MTQYATLPAEKRENSGTGSSRALRRAGKVPAVVYGGKQAELSIAIPAREFGREYQKGHFTSKVMILELGKEKIRVLPREVQVDPVYDIPLHADFQRVEEHSKVHVMVAVKFLNADKAPGIKRGGVLNIVRRDVELWCDAAKIPERLELDLSGLEIGHSVHASALTLPEGVQFTITDRDFTIATITGRSAKDDAEPTAAPAEGAEGAAEGAEGAAAAPAADAKKA